MDENRHGVIVGPERWPGRMGRPQLKEAESAHNVQELRKEPQGNTWNSRAGKGTQQGNPKDLTNSSQH